MPVDYTDTQIAEGALDEEGGEVSIQDRDEIIIELRAEVARLKSTLALEKDISDERLGRAVQAEAEIKAETAAHKLDVELYQREAEEARDMAAQLVDRELTQRALAEERGREIERLKAEQKITQACNRRQFDRAQKAEAEIERLKAEVEQRITQAEIDQHILLRLMAENERLKTAIRERDIAFDFEHKTVERLKAEADERVSLAGRQALDVFRAGRSTSTYYPQQFNAALDTLAEESAALRAEIERLKSRLAQQTADKLEERTARLRAEAKLEQVVEWHDQLADHDCTIAPMGPICALAAAKGTTNGLPECDCALAAALATAKGEK